MGAWITIAPLHGGCHAPAFARKRLKSREILGRFWRLSRISLDLAARFVVKAPMQEHQVQMLSVEVESLGERLSCLRLCDADSLAHMRRSIEQHGQLSALTLFRTGCDVLEIVDGFKRVRAARALGLRMLLARVDALDPVQAKMRMRALQQGSGLTELEEGWLVSGSVLRRR